MRSIFLLLFVFLLHANLRAQHSWLHGDWYGIGYGGLSHLRINEKEIEQGDQTFRFGHLKKSPRSSTVMNVFYKNDLVCVVFGNSPGEEDNFIQAVVFRKGEDSTYMDMIMNCPDGEVEDTARIRRMFNACDSSKYMSVRYYDRKIIERFRQLKPVEKIIASDLRKARELFGLKKDSLRSKFSAEELPFIEPTLHIQAIREILVGLGYNPMLTTSEYKNLFFVSM